MAKWCACAMVAAALLAAFARAAQPAPYELVDLASAYASFWDESRELPVAGRVAAFKARFDTVLPGFFSAARAGSTSQQYDAAIARSFDQFPKIRERFIGTTAGFARLLAPAYARFARAFPDVHPIGPVYLVHSLGEFDGGTREVSGHSRLVFGADVMAQLRVTNQTPFFHHELFHVYHAQFFSECEQMWCALWSEGLAVLAAQRLNPRATDAELLLSSPRPIRPEVERSRTATLCAVAERLNSKDAADYAALFSSGPPLVGLPARAGYFVGFIVAAEAARERSVAQLAHLDNEAARDLVRAALARLAHCPGR